MDALQKAEIIATTRNMILSMGIKSLRMDDVAQIAHVSKRTLYEEFGDKEELLFQAVKLHFDEFYASNAEKAQGAENILESILIIMGEIRKNSHINWQLRNALKKFFPQILHRLNTDNKEERYRVIVSTIQIGIRQGLIRKEINIELAITTLSYIAIGITNNNETIAIPYNTTSDEAFEEILTYVLRGISTIKGIEIIDNFNFRKQ